MSFSRPVIRYLLVLLSLCAFIPHVRAEDSIKELSDSPAELTDLIQVSENEENSIVCLSGESEESVNSPCQESEQTNEDSPIEPVASGEDDSPENMDNLSCSSEEETSDPSEDLYAASEQEGSPSDEDNSPDIESASEVSSQSKDEPAATDTDNEAESATEVQSEPRSVADTVPEENPSLDETVAEGAQEDQPTVVPEADSEMKSLRTFALAAASVSVPEYEYYHYTLNVSAPEFSDSDLASVILEITEALPDGNVNIYEWSISAGTAWQDSWYAEYRPAGTSYSISVKQAINTRGESVEGTWEISSSPVSVNWESSEWRETETLNSGSFQFLAEGNGTQAKLAAASASKKSYRVYHYPLTAESILAESSSSIWNVSSAGDHWFITNEAGLGSLTVGNTAKNTYSIVSKSDGTTADFLYTDNGLFYGYHEDTSDRYYLSFDGSAFYTTTDASSAAAFTLLQRVNSTTYYNEQCFELRNIAAVPSGSTELTVKLEVSGNIADYSLEFPFEVLVDGSFFSEFSLSSGNTYTIQNIPIGAEVRVIQAAGKYRTISDWNGMIAEADHLIFSLPQSAAPLVFTSSLNGELKVAVSSESEPYMLLSFILMVLIIIRTVITTKYKNWR